MDRVVIVGGGALGLMHAVSARRRGLDVVHLEREPGPRGATVRNFGLVWVSGRAGGPELDLALRARELWEQLGAEVPAAGFRPDGSLTEEIKLGGAARIVTDPEHVDSVRRQTDAEVFVLGGGVSESGSLLLDPVSAITCSAS